MARPGQIYTPEYKSWLAMNQRCNDTNASNYYLYGDRGIKVCERWKSFQNFLEDMGSRPERYTLDRINHDGNYEPSNCKWSSYHEQSRNRRSTRVTIEDISLMRDMIKYEDFSQKELAKFFNVDPSTISRALSGARRD